MSVATIHPVDHDLDRNKSDESQHLKASVDDNETTYTSKSIGLLPLTSTFRQWLIKTVSPGSIFDTFMLCMVILNSITMALIDYRYVNDDYIPDSTNSVRNRVIERVDVIFLVLFIIECIMKILAYGFINGNHAYIRNNWNKFDFLMVIISIVCLIPGFPDLSTLRAFRILRPLRSVGKLPGLRKIVGALVDSSTNLSNMLLLLCFLLTLFSITGMLFWKGLLHARCRLTPYPIRMSIVCQSMGDPCWEEFLNQVLTHPHEHRCVDHENDNSTAWTQSTSPWYTEGPHDCFWPIDDGDERVCSLLGTGHHSCPPTYNEAVGEVMNRTCGSNYDAFGNPRFINSLEPYGYPRMKSGTFIEALNWGFTNYDSFFSAFLSSFQVTTLEGWTTIMYQIADAWSFSVAVFIFLMQVIICGYIAMNIVLAVITESIDDATSEETDELSPEEMKNVSEYIGTKEIATRRLGWLVESRYYSSFIMGCIAFNTLILSMDHFGISENITDVLEVLNFIFSFIFIIDVVLCNAAYGVKVYWRNPSTCFDGVIGLFPLIEILLINSMGGSNSFSAIRSLRLFRVFKMARNWKSLQMLLKTLIDGLQEIGNFALLLFLFMFIYSLIGMQILANRLRFDPDTGYPVDITEDDHRPSIRPRSHFDNFFWSMVTVFQILSGENWTSVMYDAWRSKGWIAVAFIVSLMLFGSFIVMNLFLAILLKRFGDNRLTVSEIEDELSIANEGKRTEDTSKIQHRPSTIQIFCARIGKKNPLRKLCFRIVESEKFDYFVTILIILSSITLAIDNPLANPRSTTKIILNALDLCFTFIFICEMIIKMLAYGLIFERMAYLRSAWNVLDFLVVLVSILNLCNVGPGNALRALRTLRVLRPLRMINRLPELKVVVDALILCFPSVGDVAVLCSLFFLVFAIFGVNFLKGTYYHCDIDEASSTLSADQIDYLTNPIEWGKLNNEQISWFDVETPGCHASSWVHSTIPTSRDVCNCLAPGKWKLVIPQNFNNVLQGMALLFEISTTEGWINTMYAAIDQRGIDAQPIRDSNPAWALFFIMFLIIGAFFILELFVGVTIDNFNQIKEKTGRALMTQAQAEWAATQSFIMKIKPEKRIKRPAYWLRAWCYDTVINPRFDMIVTAIIMMNLICIASVNFGDTESKIRVLEGFNITFGVLFNGEVIIKAIGLSGRYLDDGWNRFDLFILCGSNIGLILRTFTSYSKMISSFVQLFRVCRLVRLIRSVNPLRGYFNTLIVSIPSLANIGSLLFLLFFMYSVIGMQLFSFIPDNEDINAHANFRSFGMSMLLLLRFSTGEDWNGFMRKMIPSNHDCDDRQEYDINLPWCLKEEDYPHCTRLNGCGAGFAGYVYFYSFILLITFVVLNLFVAIVLEAFETSNEGDILSQYDLNNFIKVWSEFDPHATWHIKPGDVKPLISRLPPPLGIGSSDRNEMNKIINDECLVDIPVKDDGRINIVHMATHLAKRIAKMKLGQEFHELSKDHPIEIRMRKSQADATKTLKEVYIERSKRKLIALKAFARAQRRKSLAATVTTNISQRSLEQKENNG